MLTHIASNLLVLSKQGLSFCKWLIFLFLFFKDSLYLQHSNSTYLDLLTLIFTVVFFLVQIPKQVAVALIKPDAVQAGLVDQIISEVDCLYVFLLFFLILMIVFFVLCACSCLFQHTTV